MYTGSILRIIIKYLNGYLSINSYQYVSSRLSGLMILLSIHSCNSSYHFLSSFYSICHGICKWWFFQNASLNHRLSKPGYFFGWRFQCVFSSVQFSCSVMSNSLRPHKSKHARPPCPSSTPEFTQTHVHRVSDAIQPSHPLSSPSPPAPNPSQHQGLFQWVNSSHEVA